MSSATFILAPAHIPAKKDKENSKEWKELIESLKEHRGGYKRIKKFTFGGGKEGYLSNRGKLDEFNLGEFSGDELTYLARLANNFPGNYLAIWTFGNGLNILLYQSSEGKELIQNELNLRLVPYKSGRSEALFNQFAKWFTASALEPDFEALRVEYFSEGISVQRWFEAFGVIGAKDIEPGIVDSDEWGDFESVATSLLQGKKPDSDIRKKINKVIRDFDDEITLPASPKKAECETARIIGESAYTLQEIVGEPETQLWKARRRAAHLYWDITDCPAGERLAGGSDEENIGSAGCMGRLLSHYPREVMRDSLFYALAGMEAEGANGHAYVESFHSLAENSEKAGFTLTIFPARLMTDFRVLHKMQSFGEWKPEGEWAAEAFIDLGPILKSDPLPHINRWFAEKKTDGMILRAEADGAYTISQYKGGVLLDSPDGDLPGGKVSDSALVESAAKALWPGDIFTTIGLPNLLEPGEWREGAYGGVEEGADFVESLRGKALKMTSVESEAKPIIDAIGITSDFPDVIVKETRGEADELPIALKITLPESDEEYQRLVVTDLSMEGIYGKAWSVGESVICTCESDISSAILVRVLGDLPAETIITINNGISSFRYRIDPATFGEEGLFSPMAPDGEEAEEDYGDYESYDGFDEEMLKEMESVSPELADDMRRQMAFDNVKPNFMEEDWDGGELIHRGGNRRFYSVNTMGLPFIDPEGIERLANEALGMGMSSLGDMICDQFNNVYIRGFANSADNCYFVLMLPEIGAPAPEYFTLFSDATSLTTTNVPHASNPKAGIFFQVIPGAEDVKTLWGAHNSERKNMQNKGREITPIIATLPGLAKVIDDFLTRQLGG